MKNLLYKEFHLVIHPMFYLVLLCGALLLIPQWAYLIALMYFFFITIPNVFSIGKAHNDIGFSVMLPVRREDIVKARIVSMVILEVLQILVTAVFAAVNLMIYPEGNFLMDTNITFIGCAFLMYALFNVIFFPMYYKTAYKIGIPVIAAITAVVLFSAFVEALMLAVPALKVLDGRENFIAQIPVLAGGIIVFILLNIAAFKLSAKRFASIDL
jgi:ABC-2 type transport system permease protein